MKAANPKIAAAKKANAAMVLNKPLSAFSIKAGIKTQTAPTNNASNSKPINTQAAIALAGSLHSA